MREELPRRFYKHASVSEGGAGVMLDTRKLKTPEGALFVAPTRALAEAVAAEWEAQGEHIRGHAMPLTQLAFAAIDKTPRERAAIAERVSKYIETDLLAHRADAPATLAARQAAVWDPLVAWGEQRFGVKIAIVSGIIAAPDNPGNLATIAREVEALDDFAATGLSRAVALAGSVVIGFALKEGALDAQSAFNAAALDDLWSLETWGEDAEARARLDRQRGEFEALRRYFVALGSGR